MTGLAGVCHASEVTPALATAKSFMRIEKALDMRGQTIFPAAELMSALRESRSESDSAVYHFILTLGIAVTAGHLIWQYPDACLTWMQNVLTLLMADSEPAILSGLLHRSMMLEAFADGAFGIAENFSTLKAPAIESLKMLADAIKKSVTNLDYQTKIASHISFYLGKLDAFSDTTMALGECHVIE